jgi:hypothetical protein
MGNIKSGGPAIPPGRHLGRAIEVDPNLTSKAGDPMAKWEIEVFDANSQEVLGTKPYWTVLTEEKGFGLKMLLVDTEIVGPEEEIDERKLDQYLGKWFGVVFVGDTYVKDGEERETTKIGKFVPLPKDYKVPTGVVKSSATADPNVPF